jgi:hypothetical protein
MMNIADPDPRIQPYWNLVFPSRDMAAPRASASARVVIGASAAAWTDADGHQGREAVRRQQAESDHRGQGGARGKKGAKRLSAVREATA